MSYDVGQHISLTHLNQSREVALKRPKKSIEATVSDTSKTLFMVGTRFIFQATPMGLKAAIQVPVAFA